MIQVNKIRCNTISLDRRNDGKVQMTLLFFLKCLPTKYRLEKVGDLKKRGVKLSQLFCHGSKKLLLKYQDSTVYPYDKNTPCSPFLNNATTFSNNIPNYY